MAIFEWRCDKCKEMSMESAVGLWAVCGAGAVAVAVAVAEPDGPQTGAKWRREKTARGEPAEKWAGGAGAGESDTRVLA